MKKTVLITGASSGIGAASARLFAARGWNVIATMRQPAAHQGPASDGLLVTRLDVEDPASVGAAIEAGIARFGRIDALVNNAGFGLFGLFESTPREKIHEQFAVNVFGVMEVTRAILPHFRQNRSGVILNVSSGAGLFTLPMISLYCASKYALEGFSEALSYEMSPLGITVKLVIPHGGVTHTAFNARSGAEQGASPPITDYAPFVARTMARFAAMARVSPVSSDDVARVIHEATTDGKDQLRYLIGDDRRGFIKARRELSDQEYVDFMRAHFTND